MKFHFVAKIILLLALFFSVTGSVAFASETNGTIVSGGNNGYAWSNQAGWVNFGCSNCGISITDSGITGYAWNNNYGWINMSPINGGVTITANGALSGYAWGSGLGWINFSGVSINSSGKFTGQASGTTVGALTFNCTNCSIATDFRAQNFRATSQPSAFSGGGGGGAGIPLISGPGGILFPAYVNAVNAPLKLLPIQYGALIHDFANQKLITLDVPSNVFSDELTFVIREEAITSTIAPAITVIGNTIFDITARDNAGNLVHALLKPVKITLNIPELLRGRSDLGVYFFDPVRSRPAEGSATSALGRSASNGVDAAARVWVKVPDAVFSGDSVSFSVDHLTLFAIFAGLELPLAVAPTFPVPIPFEFEIPRFEIEPSREGVEAPEGGVPITEITSEENPPLFDIEVSPGPSESQKSRAFIIVIMIIATAGIAFYIFKNMKRHT